MVRREWQCKIHGYTKCSNILCHFDLILLIDHKEPVFFSNNKHPNINILPPIFYHSFLFQVLFTMPLKCIAKLLSI